jgi:hypothetical protein
MDHPCGIVHKVYITNVFINDSGDGKERQHGKVNLLSIIKQVPQEAGNLKPVIQLLVPALSPCQPLTCFFQYHTPVLLKAIAMIPNRCQDATMFATEPLSNGGATL